MLRSDRQSAHIHVRPAFTLVELLVVIAIIGILVSLLLPAVNAAREAARRAQCLNKMRQLALACLNYESNHQSLPTGSRIEDIEKDFSNCSSSPDRPGQAPWTVLILPYMEDTALHDGFEIEELFTSTTNVRGSAINHELFKRDNPAFKCPTDPVSNIGTNYLTYMGVQGGGPCPVCTSQSNQRVFYDNGAMILNSKISLRKITDGTSKTFLIGESRFADQSRQDGQFFPGWTGWASSAKSGRWAMPMVLTGMSALGINSLDPVQFDPSRTGTLNYQTRAFGSHHPGGANFARTDGSLEFISESTDLVLLFNQAIRNDGFLDESGVYPINCGTTN